MRKNDKPLWRYVGNGWFRGVVAINDKYEIVWTMNPAISPAEIKALRHHLKDDIQNVTQYAARIMLDTNTQ